MAAKKVCRVSRSLDVGEKRRELAKSPVLGCKVGNEGRGKAEAQRQHKAGCGGLATSEIWAARPLLFGSQDPDCLNT